MCIYKSHHAQRYFSERSGLATSENTAVTHENVRWREGNIKHDRQNTPHRVSRKNRPRLRISHKDDGIPYCRGQKKTRARPPGNHARTCFLRQFLGTPTFGIPATPGGIIRDTQIKNRTNRFLNTTLLPETGASRNFAPFSVASLYMSSMSCHLRRGVVVLHENKKQIVGDGTEGGEERALQLYSVWFPASLIPDVESIHRGGPNNQKHTSKNGDVCLSYVHNTSTCRVAQSTKLLPAESPASTPSWGSKNTSEAASGVDSML